MSSIIGRPARRIAAVAGAVVLAAGVAAAPSAAEPDGVLPPFSYTGEPLDRDELQFNPTGEFIFPSVIRAADYVDDPLGEYYLYYAPHERPGGIAMAYADSPDGPWTEYAANPLVTNVWQPHYSVSHISSPHVIWNEDEQRLFLFFHGENSVTRYATSSDGLTWDYEDIAVRSNASTGPETSYARVFEHEVEGRGNRYLMVFMDNPTGGSVGRSIRWAVSDDMRAWEIQPEPLVVAGPDNRGNISGPHFLVWNGRHIVVYHGSDGDMWATEVGPAFDRAVPLGRVHEALDVAPDSGRSAAPAFYVDGSRLHVFYEAGGRLTATIGHAVGDLRPVDDVGRTLTCGPSVRTIWPPNRRWVDVEVAVGLDDGVLGPHGFELAEIDADGPPDDVRGAEPGTPDTSFQVRAVRGAENNDRAYRFTYTGHDEIGRPATCTVEIEVPRRPR